MKLKTLLTAFIALCFKIVLSSAVVQDFQSEVQQVVLERGVDGSCLELYRRTLPRFRTLKSADDTIVETNSRRRNSENISNGGAKEHVFVYGYIEEAIASEVQKQCSSTTQLQAAMKSRVKFVNQAGVEDAFIPSKTIPPPPIFPDPPVMTITPLHTSGPSFNRIDFVFFGDGYTKEEHNKFIDDAKRLADNIVTNQTFATVKPLLNVWAAFTPSNESGVGTGGKPKDTVYGLYRDGTELRAVYAKNELLASSACLSLGFECEYPILLGNDPLYGGLGGLVTITTSSIENGALVLRHELGHSVIQVGEEYDGGYEYSGVNADNTLVNGTKWSHWLTDPPEYDDDEKPYKIKAERSVMPLQVYAWTLLNHSSPYTAPFISSGTFSRHLVRFSLSGLPESSQLTVTLDGGDLGWTPKNGIGKDRWHYDIYREEALSGGEHTLEFKLEEGGDDKAAQLCSFEIIEFGNKEEFNTTPGHISAYPTYSDKNATTYRPTNEACLMRIVTSHNFCSPCIEGLWLSLFTRVNLVGGFYGRGYHKPDEHSDQPHTMTELVVLPLGQFRNDTSDTLRGPGEEVPRNNEHITITYTRVETGEEFPELQDKPILIINEEDYGKWIKIEIKFHTDEVRRDPNGLLKNTWFIKQFPPRSVSGEDRDTIITSQPF